MADSLAYAGTGHPAGEPVGIVVATLGPFLEKGHSTEFGAPNDQRFVEQPARSEVLDQCGYGLIEDRCVDIVLAFQIVMPVPIEFAGAGVSPIE